MFVNKSIPLCDSSLFAILGLTDCAMTKGERTNMTGVAEGERTELMQQMDKDLEAHFSALEARAAERAPR